MGEREFIGLSELQGQIGESIRNGFPDSVWLKAEISEVKVNHSGHCYLTLIENDSDGSGILAKAQAIIWASSFRIIKPFFETQTGRQLSAGMNILVNCQVQYSVLYGLSLVISDIDPSFTVGELEVARQRTIARLQSEGMFGMNSTIPLPALPRSLAVVTSETAAGYRDFMHHLVDNDYGYKFDVTLFPAVMQGAEAPSSVISALDAIASEITFFDAVLILRGGGGAMDLVCFDDYDLAVNVAQFPIPVLTGIGHDHDYHIIDMMAHTNVKTPTALADYVVGLFFEEELRVNDYAVRLQMSVRSKYEQALHQLESFRMKLSSAVTLKFMTELSRVDSLEQKLKLVDPSAVLGKGFSLVLDSDGRKIVAASGLKRGDKIRILFSDGEKEAEIL